MANTHHAAGKTAQTPPAAKKPRAPRVHKVEAGTVEGPKGKKLVDATPEVPEVTEEQRSAERRQADRRVMESVENKPEAPTETPEAKAEREKKEAFLAAAKKLAEEAGYNPDDVLAPMLKQGKTPRTDRQQKNGITRPASGTTTGAIWDVADEITLSQKRPATVAEVKAHTKLLQTNMHTIKTQYARWRGYNGVRGRIDAVAAQPSKEVPEGYDKGLEHHPARRATDTKH